MAEEVKFVPDTVAAHNKKTISLFSYDLDLIIGSK